MLKRLHSNQRGFTLLELLITMSVLVILSVAAIGDYSSYAGNSQLDAAAKGILFDLRNARERALNGESFLHWGIHFDGTNNNYQIFSSPTNYADAGTVILSTTYLTSNVIFTTPASGVTLDIIFNRISGATSAASITISRQGSTRTVNVSAIGTIF